MARSPRSGSHAAPNPPVEYRLPPFRGKEEDISSNPSSSGGASGGAASEMMTHPLAVSAIPTSAESAGTCPSTIAARRRTTSEFDPKMAMEMLRGEVTHEASDALRASERLGLRTPCVRAGRERLVDGVHAGRLHVER